MSDSSIFADFVAAFHEHFTRDPNARAILGVNRDLGELPDPSVAAHEATLDEARALLTRLAAISTDGLSFDQRLDLDLARLSLEAEVHHGTLVLNGRSRLVQCPRAGDEIGDGIFMMFINDPRPATERLLDITARIEAVPGYLAAVLARLDRPVTRWRDIDARKVDGLPDFFTTLHAWANTEQWPDADRLGKAVEVASKAMRDYAAALRSLPTEDAFQIGAGPAKRLVELRGIDMSLDELHAMARDFLLETRATVETLRARLAPKYGLSADCTAAELQRHLAGIYAVKVADRTDLDGVVARYEQERERILSFIQERDLFPVFAEQDMKIMRTPTFMEPSIPAGAMVPPAPFRDGVRTSLVYLTLTPELLDEHTELGIPSMMIHEGIPGHHLQLAHAAINASVVRRHFNAMEHAEGWTTMLEDYMLDQGYLGDLEPEGRFVGKREIGRIGARVAIDLFFMTGERRYLDVGVDCDLSSEDPFVAAGNLLEAVTGFVPGRIQAELNWYSQEHGYPLSYLTGNRMVWALKRDLAAAQTGQLSTEAIDRRFHAVYLESGNMPVSYLRRVFVQQGLLPAA